MTTKLIGVREFRANMNKYVEKAQAGVARFIVVKRNKPLFEIKPILNEEIKNEDIYSEEFIQSMKEGMEDIKAGRVYSLEEVEKMYGL